MKIDGSLSELVKEMNDEEQSSYVSKLIEKSQMKWAEVDELIFPYFVVSERYLGSPGNNICGLHFVAEESAKEPWQELIIAYHEFFELLTSHEEALVREKELAKRLSVFDKYLVWKEEVNKHSPP